MRVTTAHDEHLRLLVTVKAYPVVSTRYGEVVCVAGVTEPGPDQRWVRLYPVPFRRLEWAKRFRKYQMIELKVGSHGNDVRPETRRPNLDSLSPGRWLSEKGNWLERHPYIEPLMQSSMCEIARRQQAEGLSLGVFRPRELQDLVCEQQDEPWSSGQEVAVSQLSLLFENGERLEKVPFRFSYRYRCEDGQCPGHKQSIIDWELGEAVRRWRKIYGDETRLLEAVRQRWLDEMWSPERASALFVGSMHQRPASFLVLGVYWPRKEPPRLFD